MKFARAHSAENCVLTAGVSRFTLFNLQVSCGIFRCFDLFCRSVLITSIRGSIHQGHEAFSEHSRGRQCAFMSLATLLFNQSDSVDSWTQTNIDDILCHGDCMCLHALTKGQVAEASNGSQITFCILTNVLTSISERFCPNFEQINISSTATAITVACILN